MGQINNFVPLSRRIIAGANVTVNGGGSASLEENITIAASGGGGGNPWQLLDQNGSPIVGGSTWTYSVDVPNVDVINLDAYSELMVIARNVQSSIAGVRCILASVNNGVSFYNTGGDYVAISDAGIEGGVSIFGGHETNSTAARSFSAVIFASSVNGGPKLCVSSMQTANMRRLFVASNNPINALRFTNSAGGNLTASGSLFVFGR